jgi:hypothetical protein
LRGCARPNLDPGLIDLISSVQLAFNVSMFDSDQMGRDRHGADPDRLIVAELSGAAKRHAQWRDLTEAETDAAVAEMQEIAGGRADLLAEVAGVMLATSAGKLDEPQSKAVAQLCVAAGADESLITGWIEEGRRRAEIRRSRPLTDPARRTPRRA